MPASASPSGRRWLPGLVVVSLLVFLFILNAASVRHKSVTTDEPMHFLYGLRVSQGATNRIMVTDPHGKEVPDDSKMPFTALNTLPFKLMAMRHGPVKFQKAIKKGRWVTMVFSLLIALVVFRWSQRLYGTLGGYVSLLLYVFSPNLLAHSRLVTTDLYAVGMVVLSCYTFWNFMKSRAWQHAVVAGTVLGLSQLAKFSCAFLYPIFLLIVVLRMIPGERPRKLVDCLPSPSDLKRFVIVCVFFAAWGMLIINLGFFFNDSAKPLGAFEFQSRLFKSLQEALQPLGDVPVLLPRPYVEGLDLMKETDETGKRRALNYLLGELRREGFMGYYFIAFFVKVPLATQILILWALIGYIRRRERFDFRNDEIFLLVPVVVFAVSFNFLGNSNVGIRHFLVVFPLLHVFCGSLLKAPEALRLGAKIFLGGLLFYLIISVASYFPHYLSYFNEIVWDRKQAYRILADSNLDWNQNDWYVSQYMERHPRVFLNPPVPLPGRIAVSVNVLAGIYGGRLKWVDNLRKNLEPVDHIAYSHLVYEIPLEALSTLTKE